jgi:hypothetical protein
MLQLFEHARQFPLEA